MKRKTNQKQKYMCVSESMPMNQKGTGLVHKVTEFTFSMSCNVEEK